MPLLPTAAVLATSLLLLPVSSRAALLTLAGGCVVILAWGYRRPWDVRRVSVLAPSVAGGLSVLGLVALPVPGLAAFLLGGAGMGGTLGFLASLRHRVDWKHGRLTACPAWGPIVLWGIVLFVAQGGALSRDPFVVRYGATAAAVTGGFLAVFFPALLFRRVPGSEGTGRTRLTRSPRGRGRCGPGPRGTRASEPFDRHCALCGAPLPPKTRVCAGCGTHLPGA